MTLLLNIGTFKALKMGAIQQVIQHAYTSSYLQTQIQIQFLTTPSKQSVSGTTEASFATTSDGYLKLILHAFI